MRFIKAETCHKRAWACVQAADHENDQGRRAVLISAAYTWETLAREIDEAADREVERTGIDFTDRGQPLRSTKWLGRQAQTTAKGLMGRLPRVEDIQLGNWDKAMTANVAAFVTRKKRRG